MRLWAAEARAGVAVLLAVIKIYVNRRGAPVTTKAQVLCEGNKFTILMDHRAYSEFQKASVADQVRSRLESVIQTFANLGKPMSPTMIQNEGRHAYRGHSIQLWAFKADCVRLFWIYGKKKRTCVVVSVDLAKKQQKANPRIRDQALAVALEYLE